ncbi:MAG: HD domain-containing protein [Candidatus Niyogibacteria bacterium]|nr:HD domain-containing protein [Candidatus Niyogibacteria bacterium]
MNAAADFLFETGMLAKTPRSGFSFLGSGKQSVAEHINRTVYIGFALAQIAGDTDVGKVVMMCQFHDITEARISDLNYVHQKYNERKEERALHDLTVALPFGGAIHALLKEYEERKSREALLAKDADNLEFLLSLKEQVDVGNIRAATWIPPLVERLKTPEALLLAKVIQNTPSDRWWFANKNDDWWVNRNQPPKTND